MKKYMYRIIYILFKHVKFQYNNLVKYNSQYSVCVARRYNKIIKGQTKYMYRELTRNSLHTNDAKN